MNFWTKTKLKGIVNLAIFTSSSIMGVTGMDTQETIRIGQIAGELSCATMVKTKIRQEPIHSSSTWPL